MKGVRKMNAVKATSPFSLSHAWTLHWDRKPSNLKRIEHFGSKSSKEKQAIDAIGKVGVIGGQQLHQLFGIDKKRLKRMIAEQKVVRHEMRLDGNIIPIFTLGLNGALIAGMEDAYELNYWVRYKTEDVLKRMLFFKLYERFQGREAEDGKTGPAILPTPNPFIGAIQFRRSFLYVYVVRGEINDFLMHMKWKGESFNERLIIIAEDIRHLKLLKHALLPLKARVVLDSDLLADEAHVQNIFYFLKDGEFVKDQ